MQTHSQRAMTMGSHGQDWSSHQITAPATVQNNTFFHRLQSNFIAVLELALKAKLMFIGGIALHSRSHHRHQSG